MAAAAVPALVKMAPMAAGLVGSLFGKKTAQPNMQQQQGMAGSQAAIANLTGMANQSTAVGKPLIQQGAAALGQGGDYLNQAGNYYGKILSGDRASMSSAMAPEMAQTNDFYSGAANKVGRTMRGGSRDNAMAELDREKVGKLSMMGTVARGNAAQGAERVGAGFGNLGGTQMGYGSQLMGQGTQGAANAGYLNNMLFQQGTQVDDQQQKAGSGWGKFLFDMASSGLSGMGKKPPLGGLYNAIGPTMKSQNLSQAYGR